MNNYRLEQALYGYSDGHRLLASSIELDPESNRLLRTVTDVTFDGNSAWHSTLLPLPSQRLFAFVRTWPAPEWVRAGAVWAHVVLVDFPTLGQLESTTPILGLFRRPLAQKNSLGSELREYSNNLEWPSTAKAARNWSEREAADLITGLYASAGTASVHARAPDRMEELVYAVHEQQWPRLRRSFAARTRTRTADTSWKVDLELVERGGLTGETGPVDAWAMTLIDDLRSPNSELRQFLRRYGAESRAGRLDMPPLATVFENVGLGADLEVVRTIRSHFPEPTQMRSLKRDIFGPLPDNGPAWRDEESRRIRLAFLAGSAVDFGELELGRRLVALVAQNERPGSFGELSLDEVEPEQIDQLVTEVALHADAHVATALAITAPDVGVLVAARRPEILADQRVWDELDEELLLDVLDKTNRPIRNRVIQSLVSIGAIRPLSRICDRDRSAWWRAVADLGSRAISSQMLVSEATTLRTVLERVGAAALDPLPNLARSPRAIVALLVSADLSGGLWRRYKPRDWMRAVAAIRTDAILRDLPTYALDRLYAVALLSSSTSGEPQTRGDGWRTTFSTLHARLEDPHFDGEAWGVLANALPAGSEWDRCLRLRQGLVAEVQRDDWPSDVLAALLEETGPKASGVVDMLQRARPKKRQGLLLDLLNFLFDSR